MIADYPDSPPRLAPLLAQWDYVVDILFTRLEGLTDEALVWEPGPASWTVERSEDGGTRPTSPSGWWAPVPDAEPPRTIAWSLGHLGSGALIRSDWLVGSHSMTESPDWPITASEAIAFAKAGLSAWRDGLARMTDADLDTVGRSAYPGGLDPELPLLDIAWWVNKELLWHAAEIWFLHDLFLSTFRSSTRDE